MLDAREQEHFLIFCRLYQALKRRSHTSFANRISQDSFVGQYALVRIQPASLKRVIRQHEESSESNDKGDRALYDEQPPPALGNVRLRML